MSMKRTLAKGKSRSLDTDKQEDPAVENPQTEELTEGVAERATQLLVKEDDDARSSDDGLLSGEGAEKALPGVAQVLQWVQEALDRRFEKHERECKARDNDLEMRIVSLLEKASVSNRNVDTIRQEQLNQEPVQLLTGEANAETAQPSKNVLVANGTVLKDLMSTLPKYDGQGDVQELYDFIQKHDNFFNVAGLSPSLELMTATSRLTGMANLWWTDHNVKNQWNSPSRIRTWSEFKGAVMKMFAPPEHEMAVLSQLKTLNQAYMSITEYNAKFTQLTIQIPKLRSVEEIHYYLERLQKDVRRAVESNRDNLVHITTLKIAALPQDRIDNPEQRTLRSAGESALHASEKAKERAVNDVVRNDTDNQNRRGRSRVPSKVECFVCGRKGHIAVNCERVKRFIKTEAETRKAKRSNDESTSVGIARSKCVEPGKSVKAKALHAAVKEDNVEFVIHSGATQHMMLCKNGFAHFEKVNKPIAVADNSTIYAIGCGDVPITLSSPEGESNAVLKDVLYAPKLSHSLLSVPAINDNGVDVTFTPNGQVLLIDDNCIIAEGQREGILYRLKTKVCGATENPTKALTGSSGGDVDARKNTYRLWHQRMGHLGAQSLQRLPKLVTGIDENVNLEPPEQEICEGCMLGRETYWKVD
jgi:hypothetical protein